MRSLIRLLNLLKDKNKHSLKFLLRMMIHGSQMRISTCNSTVKTLTVSTRSYQEKILELELLLLTMISQVKSISKRPKLSKLMPNKKNV